MRCFKVPYTVVEILNAHKDWQERRLRKTGDQWEDHNRVFTTWNGKPMRPDALWQRFSKFIANTDLPYVNIHSLRHTNATLQIAGGVPIVTIAKRLGHSSQNVTGAIYAHAIKSADETAAETLENILTPTKNRETGKNKKAVAAPKSKTTA